MKKLLLDKELFDYYDTLIKDEQQVFKQKLNVFLAQESARIRKELNDMVTSL